MYINTYTYMYIYIYIYICDLYGSRTYHVKGKGEEAANIWNVTHRDVKHDNNKLNIQ